ncbi:hypothetical protein CWI39_2112p0010, partial [Hamiltosporidium magnivora]
MEISKKEIIIICCILGILSTMAITYKLIQNKKDSNKKNDGKKPENQKLKAKEKESPNITKNIPKISHNVSPHNVSPPPLPSDIPTPPPLP